MALLSILTLSNHSMPISELPYSLLVGIISEYNLTRNSVVPVLSALVVFLVFLNYSKNKLRPTCTLNRIPSPSLTSLLGNTYKMATSKDIMRTLMELAGKYRQNFPRYYRLTFGRKQYVVLTCPEYIEKLLTSSEDGHLVKSDEYFALADYFDGGVVTANGEKWKRRRKFFSPMFNYGCFPHFLEVFNRHSKHLIRDFDKMFKDNDDAKPIQTPIFERALKTICEIGMGVELNDTSTEFDTFFEEADKAKEYVFHRMARPWYRIEWIWKLHPFRLEYERNLKYIKDYMHKVIVDARRRFTEELKNGTTERERKNKTVMDWMLEAGMSDFDIREEAHTLISAGHETSAAALQFALMFLALHPEHQRQCQEEIDAIITDESKCPNGDFTLTSLAALKHTERCLKESLRIYPVIYVYGRKLQTPLRLDDNLVLPKDTTCGIFVSDLHMNPEYFPEPEKFDPSRFTPENCATRHPYSFISFSRGPRICLGYKFAMTQMTLTIARILHHFTIFTTDKLEDVPLQPSVVLTPVRGYNFILKSRNPVPPSS